MLSVATQGRKLIDMGNCVAVQGREDFSESDVESGSEESEGESISVAGNCAVCASSCVLSISIRVVSHSIALPYAPVHFRRTPQCLPFAGALHFFTRCTNSFLTFVTVWMDTLSVLFGLEFQ